MTKEQDPGRRPPGMLEDAVLAALWNGGRPMSPGDVQAVLPGAPAYTTVMTTLARLHRKGLATRTRAGRGFVYSPNVDEAAHTATAMHDLLSRRSDRAAVLARFVSELTPEDEVLLQRLLRQEEDG
ncbi:BlaI/MecI/CopY family transcriptional regulator [Actinoallomurus rhizosphaericola]|uniref:BlaI/MecI/CopY family transcriptional regulator n=1 Tax=Actinoallomurus rhizosphaericola TaxID=2952536 RepID=UPI002092FAA4|nr:BlaI/MecI/CopY family transcriptional regulator [Actinoallomurus rhizosphaericola]MCO5998030.1 BlaI/MecI/CopY family transcriptional regulator [Actinoallomurus rhizosphaericola]